MLQKLQAARQERKKQTEAVGAALQEKLAPALQFSISELQIALFIKVQKAISGAKLFADDERHTYLGTIEDEFAADSIFNEFGTRGSPFSSDSIWNEFGDFGGEFSSESPFNQFSLSPPLIVKNDKIIARLTVSKIDQGSIDSNWLKSNFKY